MALFGGSNFPSPNQILAADLNSLRACGFSGRKIETIREIASGSLSGLVPDRKDADKMSVAGVVFAMPFIMYQLWRLISPFVPASARRFTIPFVAFTTLGFVAGAAFTHFVAFPYMMAFFASFSSPDLEFMPKLEPVFDLYLKMLLAMGVVFQMPTVVFFLAKTGLVTARFLWHSFRYAFLLIFIVAAVVTPTGDMVTQTIFAAPMVGLYLLSILIAWMFGKVRPKESNA